MPEMKCGNCGDRRWVNMEIKELTATLMEALQEHPDTQKAWVHSRQIAEKGMAKLGRARLLAMVEEQERIEPKDLTDIYWSWILTLGMARALARADLEVPK